MDEFIPGDNVIIYCHESDMKHGKERLKNLLWGVLEGDDIPYDLQGYYHCSCPELSLGKDELLIAHSKSNINEDEIYVKYILTLEYHPIYKYRHLTNNEAKRYKAMGMILEETMINEDRK